METPDRAPIVAPPPLLGLIFIIGGFVARHFDPRPFFAGHNSMRIFIGFILLSIGVAVIAIARRQFISHETPVNPYRPTAALVTDGLYRISRNPIYVAFLVIVCAFAFLANSWWFFAAAILLWIVLRFGVVNREEQYLADKFGETYRSYCQRVRRWM
jgi:protein-S-isoprenylcysteine O-methyltransferase Ste14